MLSAFIGSTGYRAYQESAGLTACHRSEHSGNIGVKAAVTVSITQQEVRPTALLFFRELQGHPGTGFLLTDTVAGHEAFQPDSRGNGDGGRKVNQTVETCFKKQCTLHEHNGMATCLRRGPHFESLRHVGVHNSVDTGGLAGSAAKVGGKHRFYQDAIGRVKIRPDK